MKRRSIEEEIEDELDLAVESMLRSGGHGNAADELSNKRKAKQADRQAEEMLQQIEEKDSEKIEKSEDKEETEKEKSEENTEEKTEEKSEQSKDDQTTSDKKESSTDPTPQESSQENSEEPTKKSKAFPIFLGVYTLLLVGLILFGLQYVWFLLIDYEAGMPEVKMNQIMESMTEDTVLSMMDDYPFELSEYDTMDSLKNVYANVLDGKELTYKRDPKFRSEAPIYQIMADEERILTMALEQTGVNGHGFAVWEQGDTEFNMDLIEHQSISIKAPKNSQILVNGTPIDAKYFVTEEFAPMAEHLAEYVENVPAYVIYQVDGLLGMPEVSVNNDEVDLIEVEDDYTFSYAYAQDENSYNVIAGLAMDIAHSYATYLINKGNLSVAHSRSIGTARNYLGSMDTAIYYLWNEEYTYEFSDESVSNVVRYSDNCISCDASYVLTVRYRLNRSISYHTCIHGMYIQKDGIWYLADFELEDTEEQN